MKTKLTFKNNSLLSKLVLIVALIVGGGSSAWGIAKDVSKGYSYGFETEINTEGWTMQNCYTSGGNTGLQNYGTYSGSNCFRFYEHSTYVPQYLISPELSTSSYGVNVTFYHKGYGKDYPISFYVGYSTTNTNIESFTWGDEMTYCLTTWILCEKSFPAGTKYVAIKYNSSTEKCRLFLDDFSFNENTPYKIPTAFVLNSFTQNSATFSWTAGNSETNWKFAYSTDSDFTPSTATATSITENPYTLTGLTEGTTYYACICADYGDDHYSEWTEKIEFTPSNIVERTINDGSSSVYYFPIYYGGVAPASGEKYQSQFIIPKGSLDFATGRQINKLVFYASAASKNFGNAEFEVYLKETDNSSFSSSAFESWGTCVANSDKLSVNDNKMVIELNTPFNYSGNKNLMIGFKQTVKGTNASSFSWTGVSATNAGYYYYGTYGNRYSYLPKVTITTVPANTAPVQMGANGYTTFASTYPLDLTTANLPSGLKAYKAAVSGTTVNFTEINQTVPANTGMLLEGTANTTYYIPVAVSGTTPEGNEFLVNTTGGTFTADGGYTYFGMTKAETGSDPIVFGTFTPGSIAIPSNKAYLKVLTSSLSEARELTCVFGDSETTGINTVQGSGLMVNGYYNLAGQRVANPSKGLYIVNGKKYVVK